MILPAGKHVFDYQNTGTTIVHCLEGRAVVIAFGKEQELGAGQFLYMGKMEPHTFKAIVYTALLLTTAVRWD